MSYARYALAAAVILFLTWIYFSRWNAPRMDRFARFLLVFPVAVLATGCTALESRGEQAWLALHAIDAAQTYRIAEHPDCYREADPITKRIIGESPSRTQAATWAIGAAAFHVGVTELLLRNEHPKLAAAWQFITIGETASSVGNNFSIGIRVGAHNTRRSCAPLPSPSQPDPNARPIR